MKMKKVLAMLLAVLMIVTATVAGTVAWLQAKTDDVTNTFTVGNINIDLKEHELDSDNNTLLKDSANEVTSEDEYKVLPGDTQPKDPFVRIGADSEDCYVFIKVVEENNDTYKYVTDADGNDTAVATNQKYVTYSVDTTKWTALADNPGVYYYKVGTTEYFANQTSEGIISILTGDKVEYAKTLTKAEIDYLYNEDGTVDTTKQPKLVFTAYAVQKANVDTVADAWNIAKGLDTP